MKNPLFYHSAFPFSPFLKGVALCLSGILAGFIAMPSLAATPLSDAGTSVAPSVKKEAVRKNRSAAARQSLTGQDGNEKETAALNWQKRQPFSPASLTAEAKRAAPGKPAILHVPSGTGNRLSLKPAVAGLPVAGQTEPSFPDRTSRVFRTEKDPREPEKTVSPNTDTTGTPASSDRKDANDRGYSIGPARFIVNYEKANDRSGEKMARFLSGKVTPAITDNTIVESRSDRDNWHVGMEYATGNGRVNAAVNYIRMKDMKNANAGNDNSPASADLKTFTIGYTYDVSEKTSFYGMVARTEYEREAIAGHLRGGGLDEDSVTGFQLGVTHRF